MPSYRVTLSIGRVNPGVLPADVLPAAANAAALRTTVEARDVAVVRGEARITVRFTADDDSAAVDIAGDVERETAGVAEVTKSTVLRGDAGSWHYVTF